VDADDLAARQLDGRDMTLPSGGIRDLTAGNSASAPAPAADGNHAPGSWADGEVFDNGALRITRAGCPSRLVIAGDIDEFTHAALVAALASAARGPGEIHIDLAGVQFCDLAGLRALVFLCEAGRANHNHGGRRVVLHEFPAQLKAVLQIVGWDSVPGLVIAETAERAVIAR
jgi:anti-anti-sigma regulatory factor